MAKVKISKDLKLDILKKVQNKAINNLENLEKVQEEVNLDSLLEKI